MAAAGSKYMHKLFTSAPSVPRRYALSSLHNQASKTGETLAIKLPTIAALLRPANFIKEPAIQNHTRTPGAEGTLLRVQIQLSFQPPSPSNSKFYSLSPYELPALNPPHRTPAACSGMQTSTKRWESKGVRQYALPSHVRFFSMA